MARQQERQRELQQLLGGDHAEVSAERLEQLYQEVAPQVRERERRASEGRFVQKSLFEEDNLEFYMGKKPTC